MKVVFILPPDPTRDESLLHFQGWDVTVITSSIELTDGLVAGLDVLVTTTFFPITRTTLERLRGIKLIQLIGNETRFHSRFRMLDPVSNS